MKILFVTRDKFPPFRPAAAAIFKVELVKRGHIIDWVLQSAKPQATTVMPFGSGVAYVGTNSSGKNAIGRVFAHGKDLLNYFRVFGLIRRNRYDLVQVKDHYLPAVITLLACKLFRVPFCYWLAYPHAEGSIYKAQEGMTRYRWYYRIRGNFWRWLLYKILLPASVHVFVQSEQMKLDVALEGVPLDKMTAVPGSIDLDEIPYETPQLKVLAQLQVEEHAVVYLGTLSRVRRLDFLLRAFAEVTRSNPEAFLYMLGKGDEPEDDVFLREEANRLEIADKVIFTGHLPMETAWEYIRNAEVCVSPYFPTMILNSTSPTKLIEYMAMARATVGNDHPEQKLVIAESASGVCVPYDESAFARAIVSLLDDREMAMEMGLKGRNYVEHHRTNAHMASVVESKYHEICAQTAAKAIGDS